MSRRLTDTGKLCIIKVDGGHDLPKWFVNKLFSGFKEIKEQVRKETASAVKESEG